MSGCGDIGDKAHTVSYCPMKLRAGRLSSEGGARDEDTDLRIHTTMVGHLINRMMLESEELAGVTEGHHEPVS